MKRLEVYDELRKMHSLLKEIPERDDEWEQNAIDAIHSVLYLAEHVFVCDPCPGGPEPCPHCEGSGYVEAGDENGPATAPCYYCGGSGLAETIPEEKRSPDEQQRRIIWRKPKFKQSSVKPKGEQ